MLRLMLSPRSVALCHDRIDIADSDRDGDLKVYLDEKVTCVDFEISQDEPGMVLLCGNLKPTSENCVDSGKSVLSVEELQDFDEIEYEGHAFTSAPFY